MNWRDVADRLFPGGHDVADRDGLLIGTGTCAPHTVAVIGTSAHAAIGVELCLALADAVLRAVRAHPGRPLLLLVDTDGQRPRRRDELLGIPRYMAHLVQSIAVARLRGHRIVGLVYDRAFSGGVLATAMAADICIALPEARVQAMALPAMARITRMPEDRLRELARTSPLLASDADAFVRLGAIERVWDGDLAHCLRAALERSAAGDRRAELGLERGGRLLAHEVMARVAEEA
jgi:malonate decarboxylase gamma subunit